MIENLSKHPHTQTIMSSQPAALGQAAVDLGQAAVDLRQAADDAARIIQSISHEGDLSNASTAFSAVFARVQEDYRPSFIAEHILWFIVVNWDRFAKPDRVRWLVQQISSNERIDGDKWMPALDYCIGRLPLAPLPTNEFLSCLVLFWLLDLSVLLLIATHYPSSTNRRDE